MIPHATSFKRQCFVIRCPLSMCYVRKLKRGRYCELILVVLNDVHVSWVLDVEELILGFMVQVENTGMLSYPSNIINSNQIA